MSNAYDSRTGPRTWLLRLVVIVVVGLDLSCAAEHANSDSCLIGDRGEARAVLPEMSGDGTCCGLVEVFMARRLNGYCPAQEASSQMPFTVRCAVADDLDGAYVPDHHTAKAAAEALCALDGCEKAAVALAAANPSIGIAPRCSELGQEDDDLREQLLQRGLLAVALTLSTMACMGFIHLSITPRWVKLMVARASQIRLDDRLCIGSAVGLDDVAVDIQKPAHIPGLPKSPVACDDPHFLLDEVSPPPPRPLGPPPPGGPSPVEIGSRVYGRGVVAVPASPGKSETDCNKGFLESVGNAAVSHGNSGLVAALPLKVGEIEDVAWSKLSRARAECRAHTFLICSLGVLSTIARSVLTWMALPTDAVAILALVLCVWQFLVLVRPSLIPFSKQSDEVSVGYGLVEPGRISGFKKLMDTVFGVQAFVFSVAVCETVVLASAMAGSSGRDGADSDDADPETLTPLSDFLLRQSVLVLVIVRIYVACLLRSLHRQRGELTLAILPAPAYPYIGATGCKMEYSVSPVAEGIFSEPDQEAVFARMRRTRNRLILGSVTAFALVISVALIGIWRSHAERQVDETSSCRTAARGLNFCVPMDYFDMGQEVASYEECCAQCDHTNGCDAWSFVEHPGKGGRGTCDRIRFLEAPCNERSSHFSCRCHTGADRVGGFRLSHGDRAWDASSPV